MKTKQASSPRSAIAKKPQRKATTFRFSPVVQKRLELLGKLRRTPLNRLVNIAVDEYVATALAEVETNLAETLDRIRAARVADSDFESAISDFANAEATLASQDPLKGKPFVASKRRTGKKKTTQVLRQILNA
jgi:hypothetical protein